MTSRDLKEIAPDQMDPGKSYLVFGLFDREPLDGMTAPTLPKWRVVVFDELSCYEFAIANGVVKIVSHDADGQWWVASDSPYGDALLAIHKVYELPA